MRVACLQFHCSDGEDKGERLSRFTKMTSRMRDVDLVVLPELWLTGYFSFDRYVQDAEPIDGRIVTTLRAAAASTKTYLMAGSIIERHEGGLSNTALLFGPNGDLLLTYRKIHLFGYDSEEASLLTPGSQIGVAKTSLGSVGITTCYDLRFPEVYRLLVDMRADVVIVPAAWPQSRIAHWRLLVQARAVENQFFMVACNGAGNQGGTTLAGHSMVVGPWGEVVSEAGESEELLIADVAPSDVDAVRSEFPVLEHRRVRVGGWRQSAG